MPLTQPVSIFVSRVLTEESSKIVVGAHLSTVSTKNKESGKDTNALSLAERRPLIRSVKGNKALLLERVTEF